MALDLTEYTLPPVFEWLKGVCALPRDEILTTFNCGIGMVLLVDPASARLVVDALAAVGENSIPLGEVVARPEGGAAVVVTGMED